MTMKRTISGMIESGSLAHNRRDFIAENVDPDRVQLNICYQNEDLKEVYKELFDDAVRRYNVGKRKDRQITNYYEKIRQGKQEKLFHEVILQIGNCENMAVGTKEGDLAVKVLDEYMKDFQERNPTLRVFSCYLHQDEATPHLHIDFVPYITGWRGKGMDTKVSLKQALKSLGFQGGTKRDTELNQWMNHEKKVLAEIAQQHGIEWEQKGTHEEHLDVYNFKKKERKKELQVLDEEKECLIAENEGLTVQIAEIKEYGTIEMFLPEAGTLERASTYRDKKIKPLFIRMKNKIAAMAAQVKELTKEVEGWKRKYQRTKQEYNSMRRELDDVWKDNYRLSAENDILRIISDRYNRIVLVLGIDTIEAIVKEDIQNQRALEEKHRMQQLQKGTMHKKLEIDVKGNKNYNQKYKKNRGMEI